MSDDVGRRLHGDFVGSDRLSGGESKPPIKFHVECGSRNRYKDIITAVESCPEPRINYSGMDPTNPIALVFEADSEDFDALMPVIEKLIKATRYGRMILFRIVPQGSIVYYRK